MDPQKLSQLDPKLRDAYQRVMGTAIPQPEPVSAPNTEPPAVSEPFFIPQPVVSPQPQSPPVGEPTPEPTIPAPPVPSQNFTAPPPIPQAQTAAIKKRSGMTPILFGFVGLIFLVIYTLFWTKIFNLKLPFLP